MSIEIEMNIAKTGDPPDWKPIAPLSPAYCVDEISYLTWVWIPLIAGCGWFARAADVRFVPVD